MSNNKLVEVNKERIFKQAEWIIFDFSVQFVMEVNDQGKVLKVSMHGISEVKEGTLVKLSIHDRCFKLTDFSKEVATYFQYQRTRLLTGKRIWKDGADSYFMKHYGMIMREGSWNKMATKHYNKVVSLVNCFRLNNVYEIRIMARALIT